jgi:hypothetical protein
MLDGALLFLVTPADINPLAGDTTDSVATEAAALLAKALAERREQASPRYLLIAGALCVAATLAAGGGAARPVPAASLDRQAAGTRD